VQPSAPELLKFESVRKRSLVEIILQARIHTHEMGRTITLGALEEGNLTFDKIV
jgi:hypothetical protein